MAEPRLIRQYRAVLDATLPGDIAEEVAEGLEQTYRHHLSTGLEPEAAACAALAEFGRAEQIAAAFARSSPARRAARLLLAAGPIVGGCWAAVLVGSRAWTWPLPALLPLTLGAGLAAVIALLLTAALSDDYCTVRRMASTALIGLVLLDVTLPGLLLAPGLVHGWPAVVAVGLSLSRASFAAGAWRRIRTG